jgi:hypothetical protein
MLDFYPLVMESIKIQPEPQRLAHAEAKERGEIFTGVAPAITNRDVYAELIKAQVKVCEMCRMEMSHTLITDHGVLGLCPQRLAADEYQGVYGGLP